MQTLYIDRHDTELKIDRDRLLVKHELLKKPISIGLGYLSSIVISARVQLTSQLLLACARKNVAVLMLDARHPEHYSQYIPSQSGILQRKIKQFEIYQDPVRRLYYAKQCVSHQALHQLKLLHTWQRQQYLSIPQSDVLISRLKRDASLIQHSDSFDVLRGIEGALAKLVFQAMAAIAPTWCQFDGRNRRPPLDPINVLLSLSYTLLHAECSKALHAHAFDSMLGFYHEPVHGRDSLACDLAECLRPKLQDWVMQLILKQQLSADHFSHSTQQPCLLTQQGRAIFYPLWQKQVKVWKKYLRLQVQYWIRLLADCPSMENHNV